MATGGDIRDRSYKGTETFGEAFDRLNKGTGEYGEAVRKLSEELGRMNDLTDIQEKQLEDWLKSLDEIRDNWEKINKFVEDDLENLEKTEENLETIRGIFSDIVKDLQGTNRTANERLKVARNFRDLTGELQRSLTVQNGLSESNLKSLEKRVQKNKEIYEWTVKSLTGGSLDKESVRAAREKEEQELERLLMQKDLVDSRVRRLQEKLAKGEGDRHTRDKLKEALYLQGKFNKEKQAEINLRRNNVELLSREAQQGAQLISDEMKSIKDLTQTVRQRSSGLGIAAKFFEKVGVVGARDRYEDYVQEQVNAQREGRRATISAGDLLGDWVKNGILVKSLLAAIGLSVIKIWNGIKDVSSEIAKLQQNIGKFSYEIAAANTEFASSKQYLETANELVQQFGQNPISFIGQDEIAKLAEAKNLLGLSAEQAGNVGLRSKVAGQSIRDYEQSILDGVSAGNQMNRTTVAHGAAMREVLSTSDAITLSLGNSGNRLGQAIVAAKSLGMSLRDIEGISEKLLNFESSIENEMKAQLLTGMQMNLSRARALALQNDLEGVATEISKQGMTAVRFGQMNYIQQKAYADAIGISREELAKMVILQARQSGLSDKAIADATHMKVEQLEAMGISERWKVATEKLSQAFTPLLEVLIPIVDTLSRAAAWVAGLIGKMGTGGQIAVLVAGLVTKALFSISGAAAAAGAGIGRFFRIFRVGAWKTMRHLPRLFTSLGRGIGALGKGAASGVVGVPAILGIAAGVALLGVAVMVAGKGIEFFGRGIKSITQGFAELFKSIADINFNKILAIGPAFLSMGLGMTLALPGLVGASLALGPITKRLTKLASSQAGIQALAGSIIYLASAIGVLKTNLNGLETRNLSIIRKQAVKVVNSIEAGKLEAVSTVRQTPAVQASVKETAVRAESERLEKMVNVIANRVSGVLDVRVTNWDIDKIGRQLAVETTQG